MARKKQEIALQTEVETQEDWEEMLGKEGLTVVDVYQEWCGPCKAMLSNFRRLKNEIGDDLLHFAIAKADTVDSLEKYRGRCQPCFLFYAGGSLVGVVRGANSPLLMKTITEQLAHEHRVLEGNAERSEIRDKEVAQDEEKKGDVDEEAGGDMDLSDSLPPVPSSSESPSVPAAGTPTRTPVPVSPEGDTLLIGDTKEMPPDDEGERKKFTVALIKPNVVAEGKVDEIIEKLKEKGLEVLKQEEKQLTEDEAKEFYSAHKDKDYFDEVVQFMTSGKSVVLVLTKGDTGEGVLEEWRQMIGPTNVEEAKEEAPDSLRAIYGKENYVNALHGSDSDETAMRELAFFFPDFALPTAPATGRGKPAVQRTLALIRPDAMRERKDEILAKIHEAGFRVALQKEVHLTKEQAQEFYKEHEGQDYFDELTSRMSNGPLLALGLARDDAITAWRDMLGPKDVSEAKETAPDSLRAQFAMDDVPINMLHGSDSPETARKEMEYFFPMQHTLAVVKPDAIHTKEEIMKRIRESGFHIAARKETEITQDIAEQFYRGHSDKEWYGDLTNHMSSGKTLFMVLSREDAVDGWRTMLGPTDPAQAKDSAPDSLRAAFGTDIKANALHGSSTVEDAKENIKLVFGDVELCSDGSVKGAAPEDTGEEADQAPEATASRAGSAASGAGEARVGSAGSGAAEQQQTEGKSRQSSRHGSAASRTDNTGQQDTAQEAEETQDAGDEYENDENDFEEEEDWRSLKSRSRRSSRQSGASSVSMAQVVKDATVMSKSSLKSAGSRRSSAKSVKIVDSLIVGERDEELSQGGNKESGDLGVDKVDTALAKTAEQAILEGHAVATSPAAEDNTGVPEKTDDQSVIESHAVDGAETEAAKQNTDIDGVNDDVTLNKDDAVDGNTEEHNPEPVSTTEETEPDPDLIRSSPVSNTGSGNVTEGEPRAASSATLQSDTSKTKTTDEISSKKAIEVDKDSGKVDGKGTPVMAKEARKVDQRKLSKRSLLSQTGSVGTPKKSKAAPSETDSVSGKERVHEKTEGDSKEGDKKALKRKERKTSRSSMDSKESRRRMSVSSSDSKDSRPRRSSVKPDSVRSESVTSRASRAADVEPAAAAGTSTPDGEGEDTGKKKKVSRRKSRALIESVDDPESAMSRYSGATKTATEVKIGDNAESDAQAVEAGKGDADTVSEDQNPGGAKLEAVAEVERENTAGNIDLSTKKKKDKKQGLPVSERKRTVSRRADAEAGDQEAAAAEEGEEKAEGEQTAETGDDQPAAEDTAEAADTGDSAPAAEEQAEAEGTEKPDDSGPQTEDTPADTEDATAEDAKEEPADKADEEAAQDPEKEATPPPEGEPEAAPAAEEGAETGSVKQEEGAAEAPAQTPPADAEQADQAEAPAETEAADAGEPAAEDTEKPADSEPTDGPTDGGVTDTGGDETEGQQEPSSEEAAKDTETSDDAEKGSPTRQPTETSSVKNTDEEPVQSEEKDADVDKQDNSEPNTAVTQDETSSQKNDDVTTPAPAEKEASNREDDVTTPAPAEKEASKRDDDVPADDAKKEGADTTDEAKEKGDDPPTEEAKD